MEKKSRPKVDNGFGLKRINLSGWFHRDASRSKGSSHSGRTKILAVKVRETLYDSVEALQADLGIWLHHYNTERPHLGFETKSEGPSNHQSVC